MAGEHVELKFLSTVLSPTEIDSVAVDVREKLEALLNSRETIQDGLKTKLEKLRVNSGEWCTIFKSNVKFLDRLCAHTTLGMLSSFRTYSGIFTTHYH